MRNKVYVLELTVEYSYNTTAGLVVVASDEKNARDVAYEYTVCPPQWRDPEVDYSKRKVPANRDFRNHRVASCKKIASKAIGSPRVILEHNTGA